VRLRGAKHLSPLIRTQSDQFSAHFDESPSPITLGAHTTGTVLRREGKRQCFVSFVAWKRRRTSAGGGERDGGQARSVSAREAGRSGATRDDQGRVVRSYIYHQPPPPPFGCRQPTDDSVAQNAGDLGDRGAPARSACRRATPWRRRAVHSRCVGFPPVDWRVSVVMARLFIWRACVC
jgi:hypothetical protein